MSSLADFPNDAPSIPEVLRGVARTLGQLEVLVDRLADAAEERAQADPGEGEVLTVAEAAKELRCSESLIRAACARGEIKARMSGGWKIRRSALQAFEKRQMARAKARAEGGA